MEGQALAVEREGFYRKKCKKVMGNVNYPQGIDQNISYSGKFYIFAKFSFKPAKYSPEVYEICKEKEEMKLRQSDTTVIFIFSFRTPPPEEASFYFSPPPKGLSIPTYGRDALLLSLWQRSRGVEE